MYGSMEESPPAEAPALVCFVPTRIRALVKHGKPLSAPSVLKTKDGLDIRSVLSFLVCLCLVLVLYFTQLVPQKSRLEQAQHAMCGGDLDFVYAKDPILSTYPDFAHDCGDFTQCGNTCCVPSNGAAQAMAGE